MYATTYFDIEQTKALGSAWIPAWFQHLFPFDKILVLAGFTGILFTAIKLFIQKNNYSKSIITGLMIFWLISWFIIAPDPRFVYGILLFGIFLFAYHLISFIKDLRINKVFIKCFNNSYDHRVELLPGFKTIETNGIQKLDLTFTTSTTTSKRIRDRWNYISDPELINNNWNKRCYGTELPCLYEIDPRLKTRGKNISNGFRLEK